MTAMIDELVALAVVLVWLLVPGLAVLLGYRALSVAADALSRRRRRRPEPPPTDPVEPTDGRCGRPIAQGWVRGSTVSGHVPRQPG